jgi:hypothetical protein
MRHADRCVGKPFDLQEMVRLATTPHASVSATSALT